MGLKWKKRNCLTLYTITSWYCMNCLIIWIESSILLLISYLRKYKCFGKLFGWVNYIWLVLFVCGFRLRRSWFLHFVSAIFIKHFASNYWKIFGSFWNKIANYFLKWEIWRVRNYVNFNLMNFSITAAINRQKHLPYNCCHFFVAIPLFAQLNIKLWII